MTLESIISAFAVIALLSISIGFIDIKFNFLSNRADKINDGAFVLSVAMIIILWLFSIATVEVAQ